MTGIEIDDLYGLPLERFVPERDALARATRAEGRREDAAAIARLPRPSVAAWVVNQLVRGDRDGVKSLLAAGDALREAQAAVIEGRGDGHSLRAAAEGERAAVDDLLAAARALANEGGPSLSATIIDRVADTLHAAAFDEEAREQVREGRLERELRHVGLGALAAGPLAPAKREPAPKPGSSGKAAKQAEAEARKAAKQAEAEAREASHAARQAEVQARRRAERAARALTRAKERQEEAAQALREADDALADAQSESEAADEAHREARQRLPST